MKIAAFTMVRDEDVFLSIWLDYYGKQLGIENLYVIDHGSTNGSCDKLSCDVIRLPRTSLDETKRASLVSSMNSVLLEVFDVVIYCDVDEILLPDPGAYKNLRHYIEVNTDPVLGGVGLALVHLKDVEKPWTANRPVLAQRRHVAFQSAYCKPAITRKPVCWNVGFHKIVGGTAIRSDLYMFHLKAMDYALAHTMLERRRTTVFSEHSKQNKHSTQFHYDNATFDRAYFPFSEKDFENIGGLFDFREDIREYARVGTPSHNYGSLRRLPDRFRNAF